MYMSTVVLTSGDWRPRQKGYDFLKLQDWEEEKERRRGQSKSQPKSDDESHTGTSAADDVTQAVGSVGWPHDVISNGHGFQAKTLGSKLSL